MPSDERKTKAGFYFLMHVSGIFFSPFFSMNKYLSKHCGTAPRIQINCAGRCIGAALGTNS